MYFYRMSRMALSLFAATSLLVAVASLTAQEIHIVSPSELEDEEGDNNVNPNLPPFRFQQIFPASDFQSLPESHKLIVRFATRPDFEVFEPADVDWEDVQLRMSITSVEPQDISDVFEDNIEREQQLVYDGPLTFSTENTGPAGGPRDFDQITEFQHPFLYDPQEGNLLLEYISTTGFDSAAPSDFFDFPITSVYATDPEAEIGALLGGVVYQFTFVSDNLTLQAGDADQDFDFDQLDLVQVQISAKYLTGQLATWGEGDWNGAPGGEPGNPPAGNGLFDQIDIIAALNAGIYLTGPYAAIVDGGTRGDGQTSVVYNASTGEIAVDAPAGVELTSINIDSAAGIFTGEAAQNLGGSFDNDADGNIFKATFGGSFGSISFGNAAQTGLSKDFMLNDLAIVGSLAGGGDLGTVDLIYVPESGSALLLIIGAVISLKHFRRSTRPR